MVKKVIIWLDDIRPLPSYYNLPSDIPIVCRSVNEAITTIQHYEKMGYTEFLLNLDHDLGDYYVDGEDGIKLIHWMIETGRNNIHYTVFLHTMNPVGRDNMQALIDRYW